MKLTAGRFALVAAAALLLTAGLVAVVPASAATVTPDFVAGQHRTTPLQSPGWSFRSDSRYEMRHSSRLPREVVGTWRIVSVIGEHGSRQQRLPWPARRKATVEFSRDGQVAAFAGCNRMAGRVDKHGHGWTIDNLAATRMACVDRRIGESENAVARALVRMSEFQEAGRHQLMLLDHRGRVLMVLER